MTTIGMGHQDDGDFSDIALISSRDSRRSVRNRWRSAKASRVYHPFFCAFLLPRGAPDPGAPPCIRQRRFPRTAAEHKEPPTASWRRSGGC